MIDEAKMAGANAVKLQKRNNKKLFTKKKFNEIYNSENSLEKRMEFIEKNLSLIKRVHRVKKIFRVFRFNLFATPFDIDSADFLHHAN